MKKKLLTALPLAGLLGLTACSVNTGSSSAPRAEQAQVRQLQREVAALQKPKRAVKPPGPTAAQINTGIRTTLANLQLQEDGCSTGDIPGFDGEPLGFCRTAPYWEAVVVDNQGTIANVTAPSGITLRVIMKGTTEFVIVRGMNLNSVASSAAAIGKPIAEGR